MLISVIMESMFSTNTPSDYAIRLGARVRALRLQRRVTQARLSERAGISRPTLRALESSGKGSLETVARVMYALGREQELDDLLHPDPPSTLEEAESAIPRQRVRS